MVSVQQGRKNTVHFGQKNVLFKAQKSSLKTNIREFLITKIPVSYLGGGGGPKEDSIVCHTPFKNV